MEKRKIDSILFLNIFDRIYWEITKLYCSFYSKIICRIAKIKIGYNCIFYGKTKFKKNGINSIIIIGNNCTFRSKPTSNLIGINRPCIFSALSKDCVLEIGNNCGFSGTTIGCFKEIKLGNNVRCGANTTITDSDWHLDDPRVGNPKPVIIEDNVWLGTNVTVLKGVIIGENSIIGAGSIVTSSIPKNVIAGGNPCKVIKSIN